MVSARAANTNKGPESSTLSSGRRLLSRLLRPLTNSNERARWIRPNRFPRGSSSSSAARKSSARESFEAQKSNSSLRIQLSGACEPIERAINQWARANKSIKEVDFFLSFARAAFSAPRARAEGRLCLIESGYLSRTEAERAKEGRNGGSL